MTSQVHWQAPFPASYRLPYFKYAATAKDELGNDVQRWEAAQMIPVQGWDMLTSEKILAEHQAQEDYDAFLLTPSDVWLTILDRVALPLPDNGMVAPTTILDRNGNTNKGIFEVIGHDVENYGPQQWTPGNVTLLKMVVG